MPLTRTDLQSLASVRAADAVLLLQQSRFSSAYYLAGYAVEFGLKACASRQVSQHTNPDRDFFQKFFTHEFDKLIGLAGLRTAFQTYKSVNANFAVNWAIVSEWRPDARYEMFGAADCQLMVEAVTHPENGVLEWIKNYW